MRPTPTDITTPTPPTDPEWPARARAACTAIREDIINDVDQMEGKPFTGRVVTEEISYLRAQVHALVGIVDGMLERAGA